MILGQMADICSMSEVKVVGTIPPVQPDISERWL